MVLSPNSRLDVGIRTEDLVVLEAEDLSVVVLRLVLSALGRGCETVQEDCDVREMFQVLRRSSPSVP